MNSPFLEVLRRRVVVFDGAMGTSIQKHELTAEGYGGKEGCNEYLVLHNPDLIRGIHRSFLEVGCDAIETDTFGGSRLKLGEYGLADRTHEVNFEAARLARRIADEFSSPDKPRFVAGSLGPTGMLPSTEDPELGKISFDELADIFAEQARALVEGGVDVLLIETSQDMLEIKAAIYGIRRHLKSIGRQVPIMAQITLDVSGRMLLGTDVAAAMVTLDAMGADVIGLNCSTGPTHMREPIRFLSENCPLPISCMPNAGLPVNEGGKAIYPLKPEPMAKALGEFVDQFGVNIIGGCCGTTPEHLKLIVEAVSGRRPREIRPAQTCFVASAMKSVSLVQDLSPLLIGERINTQGSRKVKELLINDDYAQLIPIARGQVDSGAHVLDVCVALNEREDEADQMRTVIKKLAMSVEAPLVIDSTIAEVIQVALKTFPGSAIVNSINMENGRERIEKVMPLVCELGAAVIALTIAPDGMAKTAQRKFEVAREMYKIVTEEYGLAPGKILFDPLTFTLATGEKEFLNSAVETLEGIRLIKKELPHALTVLGVSNVSFGLKLQARSVLNSVFLHKAREAGLDAAIVNPLHISPYMDISDKERELAEDLIFNRREDALARYIQHFESVAADGAAAQTKARENLDHLSVEERIHHQILHRKPDGIEGLIDKAREKHSPVHILNKVLLPAMKDVGDKFGSGELILPFVLQSAEVMKKAVAHLEQFLDKKEGTTKGTVVVATVYGDVHDIGKNLVKTILSNNGYTVFDLGKQVPVNTIIDAAVKHKANAIGLSALLVSTSKQMPICVQELHNRGLALPVIVGGAAINRSYGRRIIFVDEAKTTMYGPGVFYAKDAFEGLAIMDQMSNPDARAVLVQRIREEAVAARDLQAAKAAKPEAEAAAPDARSKVKELETLPTPPFWGARRLAEVPLDKVFRLVSKKDLFRLSWGGRGTGEEWEKLVREEFDPRLQSLKEECAREGFLDAKAVYGYFPCRADGNSVVIYDPENPRSERCRLTFPRQRGHDSLCLADYFASGAGERVDVIPLQVVTVGERVTQLCQDWEQKGDYSRSYYLHGLSVQVAEALAEFTHQHIRKELGLPPSQGKRYSWGYPACPDLEHHGEVWKLMPVEREIGVSLTSAYQLVP
ncbi:MAG: methionine synthase, partial [bacterium]